MPSTTVEIKGKDNTSRAFNSVNKAIGGLKTGVLAIGTAVAGATVAFGAWFNSMRDTADRVGKVASAVKLGTEKLQKWQFAADQSGLDTEKFNKALFKLGENIAKAGEGNKKALLTFQGLNVEIRKQDGSLKNVNEVLPELADKFKLLKGQQIGAAQAVKLFGGAGTELLNFLELGSKQIEKLGTAVEGMGGIVEDEGIRTAEELNDRIGFLKTSFNNLFTPVVKLANEALKPFTTELDRAKMTLPQLQKQIQAQINKLVKQKKSLKDSKEESKTWLSWLNKGTRSTAVSAKQIQAQIDKLAVQRNSIRDQVAEIEAKNKVEAEELKQSIKLLDVVKDVSKKETELKDDIFVVNDAIETQSGLVADLSVNYEELLIQKQNQIDKNAELFEDEKDFLDDLEKEYKKKDFAYAKLVENRIASDKKMQEEATKSSLSSIQSLSSGVKDESDDLFYLYQASSIGQALMSTHESATKALTAGPYLGPILAGVIYGLGMANVNKIRKEKPPSQRYLGGNVSAGKQYLVGERGPEVLQMGRSGGNIIPNNQIGGNTNVMVNISAVDARGIDALLNERKDTLVGIINQSLQRQTRRAI